MKIQGQAALVTGGASGLGAETARALASRGAKVAVLDRNAEGARQVAQEIGGIGIGCDITSTDSVLAALAEARAAHGPARLLMNIAGIGTAKRVIGKDGEPAPLADFERVIQVNLIGTYNMTRLAMAETVRTEPLEDGERGVVVNTASIAAYDGQIGQIAYSASKGGIVGMTLPAARDLSNVGVRVCTIAPGLVDTPLLGGLSAVQIKSIGGQVPHPSRLGQPEEYAALAAHIVENPMLNGEVIRLDGALRMPPR